MKQKNNVVVGRLVFQSHGHGRRFIPDKRSYHICRRTSISSSHNDDDNGDFLVEFLKEDLQHLFDDQGIDVSKYEDSVQFEDPITKYTTIDGYIQNIQFLKNVFNPTFILRDIRRTDDYEIAFRWTMYMTPVVPFLGSLTFTGTSRLGISPESGKFNRHIDTWDAIEDQRYFSIEAFVHMLSQVVPGGTSSSSSSSEARCCYTVLVKRKEYEIREYTGGKVVCYFYSDRYLKDTEMMYRIIQRDGLQRYLSCDDDKDNNELSLGMVLKNFSLSDYLPLV